MWSLFYSLLKFGAVGLLGMGIDFLVTFLCKEKLRINKFVANGLGFSLAVVNNYALNRIWTFSSRNSQLVQQFFTFLLISCVGLALNTALVYFFHQKLRMNFYLSKVFAIGIVFLWNFTANLLITFNNGT